MKTPHVSVPNLGFQFQSPLNPKHFSKEQVKRATQTRDLHHFLSHPSNDVLKITLDQGILSRHTNLTSADVDLMNQFYGSYDKLHYRDVHITSDSFPTTSIGECIFFDLQLLPSPSIGGNTQALTFVDDFSRYLTVLRTKSKDQDDIMTCIKQLIAMYKAQGYVVRKFPFLHASITHTTPDSHCHKAERHIQETTSSSVGALSIPMTTSSSALLLRSPLSVASSKGSATSPSTTSPKKTSSKSMLLPSAQLMPISFLTITILNLTRLSTKQSPTTLQLLATSITPTLKRKFHSFPHWEINYRKIIGIYRSLSDKFR